VWQPAGKMLLETLNPISLKAVVKLCDINVAWAISVVAVKDTLPLVDVLPELMELPNINGTVTVPVK